LSNYVLALRIFKEGSSSKMNVQMQPVKSSHVRAIGYDADAMRLYVKFDNGTYAYDGVEQDTWKEFQGASSKGVFLASQIKGNYPFSRV
jgi:hypothetical protein